MLYLFSIRGKIVAVVSILLLMMAAMGAMALSEMRDIDARLNEMDSNWLQGSLALGEMQTTVLRYQTSVRDHLLADDPATEAQIENTIRLLEKGLHESFARYEALKTGPEEQEIYAEFKSMWVDYAAAGAEVLTASRNQDFATGRDVFTEKLIPLGAKTDMLFDKERALSRAGAVLAAARGKYFYRSAINLVIGSISFAILVGSFIAYRLTRDVSTSIKSIIRPMHALSQGDLSAIIQHQTDKTEIGEMARALHILKQTLIAKKVADDAAEGEARRKVGRAHRIDSIIQNFETMMSGLVDSLSSSSTNLERAANVLTTTAETTGEISREAADASNEISTSVQTVAIATGQITSAIAEIDRQVQEASRVAGEAVEQSRQTDGEIVQLSRLALQIGDVVKLINAIAKQTNLLALNATIEAARAGDAGRGFAVVASEVKALASQTAKATEDISSQIAEMQEATDASVATINDINATITQISSISSSIAAAVQAQGASTQEIARSVQRAAHRSTAVARNIGDVGRGARETGNASGQVLQAAQTLSKQSNRLKSEMVRFLAEIRAA